MADVIECIVVGAGVVGLAVARRLALEGREVIVLEAESTIGTGTSSRNSEVIHAGIYYTPGSLKGRLCVAGKRALYDFCASHGVAHKRIGKLIVATSDAERPTLDDLKRRAEGNGVFDLEPMDGSDAIRLEPALRCVAALLSPSTGIVDSHGLMLAYQGDAETHGAMIAFRSPFLKARAGNRGFRVTAGGDAGATTEIDCELLVNCAGLQAIEIARRIEGLAPAHVPAGYFLKGNYFTLSGKPPFTRLIYPVPVPGGAGTHVTVDLAGQIKFGPDTEPIAALDYAVDPGRAGSFYAAIRRYFPALRDGSLQPGYAGIRPKLGSEKDGGADFMIQGSAIHGIPGLVNLFGIESPGLTSSMAIAEGVARIIGGGAIDEVDAASVR